jgi:hypothetical protein
MKRRDIIGVIFIAVIIISIFGFWFWNLPPSIDIPLLTDKNRPNNAIKISCASITCSYYQNYEIEMNKEDVVRYYIDKKWNCKEIRDDRDLAIFHLQKPYWECSGPAFPKGSAIVGIYQTQPRSKVSSLIAYVYW